MSPEKISEIISHEIAHISDLSNVYALNLNKVLVKPFRQFYQDTQNKNCEYKVWTVLEESEDEQGYTIFYEEAENCFGLGMKSANGEIIYLGLYGTFLHTLKSM